MNLGGLTVAAFSVFVLDELIAFESLVESFAQLGQSVQTSFTNESIN